MIVTIPRTVLAVGAVAVLALAACTGGNGAPSSAAASASDALPSSSNPPVPSATPPASAEPSGAPSAEPTDNLGPFTCQLPIEDGGTVARAQITDVRVGEHAGYDRVVFEFAEGIPPYSLSEVSPPFTMDPSGLPLEVDGSAVWQLVLNGGTAVLPDGGVSYDGPTNFAPGFLRLVQLVNAGDFEAVSSWFIGMSERTCVRVIQLSSPARLVIDIEH